uniref:Uncharacterized protein n=1 Tax=Octactis speculum TaxID=3111310 RepID=A0A7S2CNW2_9STRA
MVTVLLSSEISTGLAQQSQNSSARHVLSFGEQSGLEQQMWDTSKPPLCTKGNFLPICTALIVLRRQRVTFCNPAKVASTSIRKFFLSVADGDVTIPFEARFPVHQANWTFLNNVPTDLRKQLVTNDLGEQPWLQFTFIKKVLDRFVSGYLDKIRHACEKDFDGNDIMLAKSYYYRYGFSCAEHGASFDDFLSFMERIGEDNFEGHFASQSRVCDSRYPFTNMVLVDDMLDSRLAKIGVQLDVKYIPDAKSRKHRTNSSQRLIQIFMGKHHLVERVLKLFERDCQHRVELCDVRELLNLLDDF